MWRLNNWKLYKRVDSMRRQQVDSSSPKRAAKGAFSKSKQLKRIRQQTDRSIGYEALEVRQLLAVAIGGNDCPPDLDTSQVVARNVTIGDTVSFNLFDEGATVVDLDSNGNPTGDSIRLILDPDIGTDTPVGAAISSEGVFTWTPTIDQVGEHTIVVIAVDNGSTPLADAETFVINVTAENTSPDLTAIPAQTAIVGQELVVDVTASDADAGQSLTFFLDPDSPAGATIEQTSDTTATIRFTPQATDLLGPIDFGVLVADNGSPSLVDVESFSVVVSDAPDNVAPEVQAAPTGVFNSAFSSFDVTFSEELASTAFDEAAFSLTVVGGANDGQTIPVASVSTVDNITATVEFAGDLAEEDYLLTVNDSLIADLAGNFLTGDTAFNFTIAVPVALTAVAPLNGAANVRTTRELSVSLSEPIDPSTVNSDSFYLLAGGEKVNGTIRVGSDNLSVTLFPDQPLPSSTRARLVVDGSAILDAGGLPIDANGDGTPGGEGQFEFTTVGLTRIAGTSISGFVYDSTSSSTTNNVPIVGLTIRVEGIPELTAITDENGFFTLQDTPGTEFFVEFDPSTVTSAPAGFSFVGTSQPFQPVVGQAIELTRDGAPRGIFLPLVRDGDTIPLVPNQPTTATFSETSLDVLAEIRPDIPRSQLELLSVDIPADSLFFRDGTQATEVSIFPLDVNRIPVPVPEGFNPAFVFSIEAGGAENFDRPATITYPNVDGLAPGEQRFIFSFDHDLSLIHI